MDRQEFLTLAKDETFVEKGLNHITVKVVEADPILQTIKHLFYIKNPEDFKISKGDLLVLHAVFFTIKEILMDDGYFSLVSATDY